MTLQQEVRQAIERNMELMLHQAKAYAPFLKVAFPRVPDLSSLCYNLMVGNAIATFMSEFAMRMASPGESDFADLGSLVEQYRQRLRVLF